MLGKHGKKWATRATRLSRGYKTMSPEEYLLNQRDANNLSRIQMTSLFPLKNSSKPMAKKRPFGGHHRRDRALCRPLRRGLGEQYFKPRHLQASDGQNASGPRVRADGPQQLHRSTAISGSQERAEGRRRLRRERPALGEP